MRYQATKSVVKDTISQPSPVKKRKKTFLDFDAEIFTSEGSSDEDDYDDNQPRKPIDRNPRTRPQRSK